MSETTSFGDLKAAVSQMSSDVVSSNQAVAANIAETKELIQEYLAAKQAGNEPNDADLEAAVGSLRDAHATITASTESLNKSTQDMQSAQPTSSAPVSDPAPAEPTPAEPTPAEPAPIPEGVPSN